LFWQWPAPYLDINNGPGEWTTGPTCKPDSRAGKIFAVSRTRWIHFARVIALAALVFGVVGQSTPAQADETNGLVEVEIGPEMSINEDGLLVPPPYKQRRSRWGKKIQFTDVRILPERFLSGYADHESFTALLGTKPMDTFEFTGGIKLNYALGSIGIDLSYATGSAHSETEDLSITRTSGSVIQIFDNLFKEPYFAPFVRFGMYTIEAKETVTPSPEEVIKMEPVTTSPAVYYSFGALIQLNWLDPETAADAYQRSGLENSYLEISGSIYTASSRKLDPNFETSSPQLGVGVMVEF
jgi:hypothetical protein